MMKYQAAANLVGDVVRGANGWIGGLLEHGQGEPELPAHPLRDGIAMR
jgi:hypothetical protein